MEFARFSPVSNFSFCCFHFIFLFTSTELCPSNACLSLQKLNLVGYFWSLLSLHQFTVIGPFLNNLVYLVLQKCTSEVIFTGVYISAVFIYFKTPFKRSYASVAFQKKLCSQVKLHCEWRGVLPNISTLKYHLFMI